MTFFNAKNFISLFTVTLLVSCSGNVDEIQSPEAQAARDAQRLSNGLSADISVSKPQAIGETSRARQKNHKYYTVEACLKATHRENFHNFKVNIVGTEGTVSDIADINSCVQWEEYIHLDMTKGEYVVEFSKTIQVRDTNYSTTVNYGINPQDDTSIDLSKSKNRIKYRNNKLNIDDTIGMKKIKMIPSGLGEKTASNDEVVIDVPFALSTCFNYETLGTRLKRQYMDFTLINNETGDEIPKNDFRLDEDGCAELNFTLKHERYTDTRRIPFTFRAKSKNPNLRGAYVEREICINPWSPSGWSFGHDTLSGPCPKDAVDQKAKLFLDEVRFEFLGHDHDQGFYLNKNLDLVMVKSYVVDAYPKIHYGNFIHTKNPVEPVYEGNFRLKVALLAPIEGDIELTDANKGRFKVISTTSKVVKIEANRLKKRIDLPIKFNDLPYVHTRTYVAVKLEAVEESEINPIPSIATGVFHASSKATRSILHGQLDTEAEIVKEKSISMNSLKLHLNRLFDNVNDNIEKISDNNYIQNVLATKENYSAEQIFLSAKNGRKDKDDYLDIKLSDFKKTLSDKLSQEEIEGIFVDNYSRTTLRKLCTIFFSAKKTGWWVFKSHTDLNYRKCIKAPETMLNLTSYKHILGITSKPTVDFSEPIRFYTGTGQNNYINESDRIGTSRSVKVGIGAKLDIPKIPLVGINTGLDISHMSGHDLQIGESNRADNGMSIDLYADKITLGFKAVHARCFTVDGINTYWHKVESAPIYSSYMGSDVKITEMVKNNRKRIRICDDKVQESKLQESWYYIGEGHQFHTILRDRLNMKENNYTILVRGTRNLAKFAETMRVSGRSMFDTKVRQTVSPDMYMREFFHSYRADYDSNMDLISDGAIPGTIEEFSALSNAQDQFYGELPVEDFNPWSSKGSRSYE